MMIYGVKLVPASSAGTGQIDKSSFTADNLITNYHEANNRLFIIDLSRLGNGRITVRLRLGGDRRSQDIL